VLEVGQQEENFKVLAVGGSTQCCGGTGTNQAQSGGNTAVTDCQAILRVAGRGSCSTF
jgi:hypothetical protein